MTTGIWNNSYVQELGIFDHCQELITLKNQLRVEKAKGKKEVVSDIEKAISREMMDLQLILEAWGSDMAGYETTDKQNLRISRMNKFIEKSKTE